MLSFVFTYLFPSLGMGLLLSLLWSQRRARKLGAELVQLKMELAFAFRRIQELDDEAVELRRYKDASEESAAAAKELVLRAGGAATLAMQRAQEIVRMVEHGGYTPYELAQKISEAWNAA